MNSGAIRRKTHSQRRLRRISPALSTEDSYNEIMMNPRFVEGGVIDPYYDDDNLAPVMPAIDVVQQLIKEEEANQSNRRPSKSHRRSAEKSSPKESPTTKLENLKLVDGPADLVPLEQIIEERQVQSPPSPQKQIFTEDTLDTSYGLFNNLIATPPLCKQEDYEFIPKSVILDVYSNDPEVKRFLRQLPRIGNESGYNEQDYKCFSCRRPIGMVFGKSRLCNFDGRHYCSECHLGEKSVIPARILCNWDFNRYPISKRNQHFMSLISNEPMFDLKIIAPLLYKHCPELREVEELRSQAFFIRSYCFTCVQDSISFKLTKLVWPREHLIKHIDLYSLEDLVQIKNGSLQQVLKNVIKFGRQHVLSCVLCCQKGFICELCKSAQIIYPFDTETVHRCNSCQIIYHKTCFKSKVAHDSCPRCQRLRARRDSSR